MSLRKLCCPGALECLLAILATCGAVLVASRASLLLPARLGSWTVLMSAGVLVALAAVVLLESGSDRANHITSGVAKQCVIASVAFLVIARLLIVRGLSVPRVVVASILAAATVEELIFRLWLPAFLAKRLQTVEWRGTLVAQLTAQGVFAACHVIPFTAGSSRHVVADAPRLMTLGLLYALVVCECGIWASIVIHASMNAELVSQSAFVFAGANRLWFGASIVALVAAMRLMSAHMPSVMALGRRFTPVRGGDVWRRSTDGS